MIARLAIVMFVLSGIAAGSTPALAASSPAATSSLAGQLLTKTELPSGWKSTFLPVTQTFHGSCFEQARSALRKIWASTGFTNHKATFDEFLTESSERGHWQSLSRNLATCRKFKYQLGKHSLTGTVRSLKLPSPSTASSAYVVGVVGNLLFTLVEDVVLFQARTTLGAIVYVQIGKPNPATIAALTKMAVAKAEGQPVSASDSAGSGASSGPG